MAIKTAVSFCRDCGHFKETHSNMMGCMSKGDCNYGYVHYCTCEKYHEIDGQDGGGRPETSGGEIPGAPTPEAVG